MIKKATLFLSLTAICLSFTGCHKTSNDDGLQAYEQRALDILENYSAKASLKPAEL